MSFEQPVPPPSPKLLQLALIVRRRRVLAPEQKAERAGIRRSRARAFRWALPAALALFAIVWTATLFHEWRTTNAWGNRMRINPDAERLQELIKERHPEYPYYPDYEMNRLPPLSQGQGDNR